MKQIYTMSLSILMLLSFSLKSQTEGSLTVSFTQVAHSGMWGAKHVLAVWIQDENGSFVKTKMRYWGTGTNDHLPIWLANSNGNTIDATTGATLTSYTTRSFVWNGKDVNNNTVPDGTYKVTIEECWSHGTTGNASVTYTFTKSGSDLIVTPSDDANFTNVNIHWEPTNTGTSEIISNKVDIFPIPANENINIQLPKGSINTSIEIVSLSGKTAFKRRVYGEGLIQIPVYNWESGLYLVRINSDKSNYVSKIVVQ
ncbi:MAG: DUF2271 domain-containing protein [Bacteroidales bacterium]|nr:DUF2271 domain-containing protein [Bacteroidales bacterium]